MTVNGSLDYEAASSHDITVLATSDDGSSSSKSFTISVADDPDEYDVSAITDTDSSPNQVLENSPLGTPVGIDAFAIDADNKPGFVVNIIDNNGKHYSVTDQGVTLDSPVGFCTSGTDLIWRSEEDPTISLVLNETKPQMNDGSPGSVNGYSHVELPNGNIAVSYAVAVVKDLGGGVTDGIQDVYVRVFDPSTGLPVTDEVNLTNGSIARNVCTSLRLTLPVSLSILSSNGQ